MSWSGCARTWTGSATTTDTAAAGASRVHDILRSQDIPRGQDIPRVEDILRVQDILEQEIIRKAVALLSGPGGLPGFLRRRQLGTRLGGRGLPLDVGVSSDIPAAIRRAVIERD